MKPNNKRPVAPQSFTETPFLVIVIPKKLIAYHISSFAVTKHFRNFLQATGKHFDVKFFLKASLENHAIFQVFNRSSSACTSLLNA